MKKIQSAMLIAALIPAGILPHAAPAASDDRAIIPENIRLITGKAEERNYRKRLWTIHDLGVGLAQRDVDLLLEFLRQPLSGQKNPALGNIEYNALKNEIFNILMRQRDRRSLGKPLIEMFNDRNMDLTWRDYCVQFMGQWYSREPDPKVKEELKTTLTRALEENQQSIAGAALTALYTVNTVEKGDGRELADQAVKLLSNPATHLQSKIGALDIATRFRRPEALEAARQMVKDSGNTDKTILMASIATLGSIGDRSDLALLNEMNKSYDSRIRIPTQRAIALIRNRGGK